MSFGLMETGMKDFDADFRDRTATVSTNCTCGDYRVANSDELTEILYFKHFFDGFIFKKNSDGSLKKSKIDSFLVRVCVDLETMDTS